MRKSCSSTALFVHPQSPAGALQESGQLSPGPLMQDIQVSHQEDYTYSLHCINIKKKQQKYIFVAEGKAVEKETANRPNESASCFFMGGWRKKPSINTCMAKSKT